MRKRRRLAHFLDRFPDEPMELAPGRSYRLGRGSGNHVFVPDEGVSRLHAEIRWSGDSFVIADLASANGTFVNGERVLECVLRHGDEIQIGSRLLGFRSEDESAIGESYRRRKRQVKELNTAVNYQPLEGGLAGALAEVPMADIIQMLERARKTGRLYVSLGPAQGVLCFRDGSVVSAEWTSPEAGDLADHEAAYAILALADGVFEFMAEDVDVEPRMTESTHALLLESMRRMDERTRSGNARPA